METCQGTSTMILVLPAELLIMALSFLDPVSLVRCRQLSTHFDEIINKTPLLKYTIELKMWAYEDVPQPRVTVVHRLASLRAEQLAWGNPQVQVTRKYLKLPFDQDNTRHPISTSDGSIIFATSVPAEDPNATRTRIDFLYLDDVLDDSYRKLSPLYIGGAHFDAHVDLRQRLLVTIESEGPESIPVHFRSLPGWDSYPQAKQVTLNLPPSSTESTDVFTESIVGDYALFARNGDGFQETYLYHWPTTTHMMTWRCTSTLMLPTNHIMNMNHRREFEGRQPFLEIWSIPPWPSQTPVHLATYLLPFFHGDIASPFLLRYNFDQHVALGHSFRAHPYAIINIANQEHELIVPLSTLLRPQITASTVHVEYSWAEWGPRSSRLFHPLDYAASCGYRILCGGEVLDFSPLTAGENTSSHHSLYECTNDCYPSCTDWHSDGPGVLPYRRIPCKLPRIREQHHIFFSQTKDGPKLLMFDFDSPANLNPLVDIVSL